MFIGGQWVEASSRDHFESDDPFRAEPWALMLIQPDVAIDHDQARERRRCRWASAGG